MSAEFRNDYGIGAHPRILEALTNVNASVFPGYGQDAICQRAERKILALAQCPRGAVHFLVGGTQTNTALIAAALRPYEAAISAQSGHIAVHETGAVEASGHKVCTVEAPDGKLTPERIRAVCQAHTDEHMVKPRLVYLSDSTELGTIYTKAELTAISCLCREQGLLLYLDGARLGAALTAPSNDLTLPDIAALTDAFSIGGTKNGALFGEALCISHPALQRDFRFLMKQRGAMLAKGWLLGLQFETLLEDGLYFQLARHGNEMARRLQAGLEARGFAMHCPSPTNQIFPLVPPGRLAHFTSLCSHELWSKRDGASVIRLVTSWATTEAEVDAFLSAL